MKNFNFNNFMKGLSKTKDSNEIKMSENEEKKFKESKEYQKYHTTFQEDEENYVEEANMQGRNVQEVLNLDINGDIVGLSHNCIEHYMADLDAYYDVCENSPIMQETINKGMELIPTFEYLYEDIYLSLYKHNPIVIPENSMHKSVKMNRKILEILLNTPEYIALRGKCCQNDFLAGWGAETIGKEALEIIKKSIENVKDLKKQIEELDSLLEEEDQLDDIADELSDVMEDLDYLEMIGDTDSNEYKELLDKMDELKDEFDASKELANEAALRCDEIIDNEEAIDEIREVITKMGKEFDEASEEIQGVKNVISNYGFESGNMVRISYQNKKEAVTRILESRTAKQLTEAIGRMRESAITEQKKKAKHGKIELNSVNIGDKIEDTIPSERMNLINDITKRDFHRRFAEHQLMTYEKESNKEKNKGPVIVCVDTSGSMSGDREIWSKAMAIAMLDIAQFQKRDYSCIIFDSNADKPIIIEKNEAAPQKIIDIAENNRGGGTSYEPPLREALELIKDSRFTQADILFITDGECSISDEFLREFKVAKNDKEFQCFGVVIDMGHSYGNYRTVQEFCDKVTTISSVADLKDSKSEKNKSIFLDI